MNTTLVRSTALNNIPSKKLQEKLSIISHSTDELPIKNIKTIALNRYAESNIPLEYWDLKMERDFHGDERLLIKYQEYIKDLKSSYANGYSICFAGPHGTGKSLTSSCILKAACNRNYQCLYTTLSDIVNILTQASNEEKYLSRRELILVDFLVIDEFDQRFMPSETAADLYARNLENVFRTRSQNKLPTLMCTNSPNVIESFTGSLKVALNSLIKGYLEIFPIFGEDFRKKKLT